MLHGLLRNLSLCSLWHLHALCVQKNFHRFTLSDDMLENDQIKLLLSSITLNDDKAAYKQLFLLLHSRLKQFAYSILKSNEEAEELVSDLFIRIWEKRSQLSKIQSPLLYFYTSTKKPGIHPPGKNKKATIITGRRMAGTAQQHLFRSRTTDDDRRHAPPDQTSHQ